MTIGFASEEGYRTTKCLPSDGTLGTSVEYKRDDTSKSCIVWNI